MDNSSFTVFSLCGSKLPNIDGLSRKSQIVSLRSTTQTDQSSIGAWRGVRVACSRLSRTPAGVSHPFTPQPDAAAANRCFAYVLALLCDFSSSDSRYICCGPLLDRSRWLTTRVFRRSSQCRRRFSTQSSHHRVYSYVLFTNSVI